MITIGDYLKGKTNVEESPFFAGYRDLAEVLEMWTGDVNAWMRCPCCSSVSRRYRESQARCFDWCEAPSRELVSCKTVGDILQGKRQDPGYQRLKLMIQTQGFTSMIWIAERQWNYELGQYVPCVRNGNHRIAVCAELGITRIPYTHAPYWEFDQGPEVAW